MMGSGLSRARRTVGCSSGTRRRRLRNVCYRATRTLVRPSSVLSRECALTRFSVISIDLSPAGSVLATGSGDWQARICTHLSLLFTGLPVDTFRRELQYPMMTLLLLSVYI